MSDLKGLECIRERKTEVERQLKTIYHKIELYEKMKQDMIELREKRELELAELVHIIQDFEEA